MKIGRLIRPSIVFTIGDFFDFYCISDFDRDPNRSQLLDQEIKQGLVLLQELKTLKAERYIFIAGNHEFRLERHIKRNTPALANMVNLQDILKLKTLGYEYVPYQDYTTIGKCVVTHCLNRSGDTAHTKAVEMAGKNIIMGHTHRLNATYRGSITEKTHVGMSIGWLGDPNQLDYKHKLNTRCQFIHGCYVGYLDTKTEYVYSQLVPFVNSTAVVNGQLIK